MVVIRLEPLISFPPSYSQLDSSENSYSSAHGLVEGGRGRSHVGLWGSTQSHVLQELQRFQCAVGVLCITEFKKKRIKGQIGGVGGAWKERGRGGYSLGWISG